MISPAQLPDAKATDLSPLLGALLEALPIPLARLVEQSSLAMTDLAHAERPTSYEGLLDVARFCIDEDPGWTDAQRAELLGGHPRIGEKKGVSAASALEQGNAGGDEEQSRKTDELLTHLNALYEQRYPSLRYVTFVAGRSRSLIADELSALLGPKLVSLAVGSKLDEADIVPVGSAAWKAELERGEEALWEIAASRAAKIAAQVEAGTYVDANADATATPSTPKPASDATAPRAKDEGEAFDVPFLSASAFAVLVHKSPLLRDFFETDLPGSFRLEAPAPQAESAREALATLAAVAVTGGGGGGATAKRVRGLLGGLLGEVGDRVGKVTGRETRTGPKPSFSGTNAATMIEQNTGSAAAGVQKTNLNSATSTGDLSGKALGGAEENARAAAAALVEREEGAFVIDEAVDGGEDVEEEDVELSMDRFGAAEEEHALSSKEAQIAKDLRTAAAQ